MSNSTTVTERISGPECVTCGQTEYDAVENTKFTEANDGKSLEAVCPECGKARITGPTTGYPYTVVVGRTLNGTGRHLHGRKRNSAA